MSSCGFSLRVKSTGDVVGLEAGVVGDERGGLVQQAGHLAVAVRLDPSGGLRGDGEQLREGAEDAVLAVSSWWNSRRTSASSRASISPRSSSSIYWRASFTIPADARTWSRRVRVTGGRRGGW
ncbi:hypothetical protein [Streptomyces sp. AV19]|uniref:hypothetical protein n=1 Tax=Streptomyces sp. AV19 TaxID=2793068 RepID=UPI0032217EF5